MAFSQDFRKFLKNLAQNICTQFANKRRCCAHTPKPKLDIVLNVFGAYTGKFGATHHQSKSLTIHQCPFKNFIPEIKSSASRISYMLIINSRDISMQIHQELSSQSMWIKYDHSSLNPLSQTTHNLILSKNKIKTKTKFKLEKKCT